MVDGATGLVVAPVSRWAPASQPAALAWEPLVQPWPGACCASLHVPRIWPRSLGRSR